MLQAKKFLPYGFGPGSQTVILEAGSVDDDEEDYGDYQVCNSNTLHALHSDMYVCLVSKSH